MVLPPQQAESTTRVHTRWQDDDVTSSLWYNKVTIVIAVIVMLCWLISILCVLAKGRVLRKLCGRIKRKRHRIKVGTWSMSQSNRFVDECSVTADDMEGFDHVWHTNVSVGHATVDTTGMSLPPSYREVMDSGASTRGQDGSSAIAETKSLYGNHQRDQDKRVDGERFRLTVEGHLPSYEEATTMSPVISTSV